MKYQSINPYSGELLREYEQDAFPDLEISTIAYSRWSRLPIAERAVQLTKLARLIDSRKEEYAHLITTEMGKPYREALYEINKVLTAFEYYTVHAAAMLKPQIVQTVASKSYIAYEPLGVIFSIMPWNFPFWQVFRFAVPTLMAGNVTILKHAPCVPQCAAAIEGAFQEAGLMSGLLRSLYLSNEDAALLIAHSKIAGVSFTGSDITGANIASTAGKAIKKCVIELGGNDAFIVLEDADIELAVAAAVKSRSINSGQSCNAAKRFIVTEGVYDNFLKKLIEAVQLLQVGNPMLDTTNIGPLARRDLTLKVRKQITDTLAQGAIPCYHSFEPLEDSNFVAPIVLADVKPFMTAFNEEIFGPVWSVIKASSSQDAIRLANLSQYGLGASIWSRDSLAAEKMATELEVGNVFINEIVKSDARLPFGGIKRSGVGRELSEVGLKEFVNIKTIFIH